MFHYNVIDDLKNNNHFTSESELVELIKTGDENAFRYLVNKYQVNVIRTCRGFVHSSADAEDIAQEVFIEVFESAYKFRGNSEIATWIYRIAVNKSINFLRSSRRRKLVSMFDAFLSSEITGDNEPRAGEEMAPDNTINNEELVMAIRSAMSSLSIKQRTAFILSKYDELSYKEIGLIMETSVSSVESLIFRAKNNLQKKLFGFYKKNLL